MTERDELVQKVAGVLRGVLARRILAHDDYPGQTSDEQATAVVDVLGERLAAAWDEGARAAWERSGEGWNGEYPDDAEPWEPDASPNPYRTTDPKEHDR